MNLKAANGLRLRRQRCAIRGEILEPGRGRHGRITQELPRHATALLRQNLNTAWLADAKPIQPIAQPDDENAPTTLIANSGIVVTRPRSRHLLQQE
jgi:hypothetical protein